MLRAYCRFNGKRRQKGAEYAGRAAEAQVATPSAPPALSAENSTEESPAVAAAPATPEGEASTAPEGAGDENVGGASPATEA